MLRCMVIMLVSVCLASSLQAQTKKMEREKRIKKADLPATTLGVLEGFIVTAKKVKYYKETDGKKVSYEVKFLLNKNHYSVEFNEGGHLEDVELLIRFADLSATLRESISKYLKKFDKYKIKKIQKQFSAPSQPSEQVIKKALQGLATEIVRYEIVVETRADASWTTYEMLFDEKGDFISQKEVVGRLADHILY